MRYLRKKAVFKIQIHCWFYINLRRYLLLSPTCLPLQIFIKRRYSLWQRLEWGRVLESLLIFGQTFMKMAIIYHLLLLYLSPWILGSQVSTPHLGHLWMVTLHHTGIKRSPVHAFCSNTKFWQLGYPLSLFMSSDRGRKKIIIFSSPWKNKKTLDTNVSHPRVGLARSSCQQVGTRQTARPSPIPWSSDKRLQMELLVVLVPKPHPTSLLSVTLL